MCFQVLASWPAGAVSCSKAPVESWLALTSISLCTNTNGCVCIAAVFVSCAIGFRCVVGRRNDFLVSLSRFVYVISVLFRVIFCFFKGDDCGVIKKKSAF